LQANEYGSFEEEGEGEKSAITSGVCEEREITKKNYNRRGKIIPNVKTIAEFQGKNAKMHVTTAGPWSEDEEVRSWS